MGMNYYILEKKENDLIEHPLQLFKLVHIGKKNFGWVFLLSNEIANSWQEIQETIKNKIILNEKYEMIAFEELKKIVEDSYKNKKNMKHLDINNLDRRYYIKDNQGYEFMQGSFN